MRNISAVFINRLRDTFKNKACLIQFVMLPLMAVIMENAITMKDMPEHFFVKLFSVMFSAMAPITCMASMIAEEKEKGTLKALLMSGVRPSQYLFATGAYVFIMCMAGTSVFTVLGEYSGAQLVQFVIIMSSGIVLSMITGAVIGLFSRDQMTATSISVPVMMIFSFLPMISTFNKTVEKYSAAAYSQQISKLINNIGTAGIPTKSTVILLINFAAVLILFFAACKRQSKIQ